jgi:hypothetical protein
MPSRVFRQATLDRLASAEQLDELVRIGDPLGWLALAAAAALIAGALAWGFYGSLAAEAPGEGVLVRGGEPAVTGGSAAGELLAVLYVPAAQGREVRPGMRACVVPAGLEEYGCLLGEVRRVAERPGDPRQRLLALGGEEAAAGLRRRGPLIEVEVALARDARTFTGYRWSASRGPEAALVSGTPAAGSILMRRYRPLEFLLPAASGGRGR